MTQETGGFQVTLKAKVLSKDDGDAYRAGHITKLPYRGFPGEHNLNSRNRCLEKTAPVAVNAHKSECHRANHTIMNDSKKVDFEPMNRVHYDFPVFREKDRK
jgi:hypothetical protein